MTRHVVVRVWLADRPGSLGQLASKIGEVGGDLVGIDILERDGARAVDELTVELPEGFSGESLADAISQLPGIEVEDLRHLVSRVPYSGRDPLDAAVLLAEAEGPTEVLDVLAQGVCAAFACDWSTVLEMGGDATVALAETGSPPSAAWLGAFVGGASAGLSVSSADTVGLVGPRDIAWAPLDLSDLVVVAGRDGPPFRSRERRQLHQLCRLGSARWRELTGDVASSTAPPRLATAPPRLAAVAPGHHAATAVGD
jgi:hypothetical protein